METTSKLYVISIKTPNRIFHIGGRPVRTPFTKTVTLEQKQAIENRLATEGVMNYSIKEYNPSNEVVVVKPVVIEKPKKEKKTAIKSSTLNQLIDDAVNQN